MTKDEFEEKLLSKTYKHYPDYNISFMDVKKNNGVILRALIIRKPGNDITPTMYIDDAYKMVNNGDKTIDDVVDELVKVYEANTVECNSFQPLINYEYASKNIFIKVINTKRNKELLKNIPHIDFLDMSIVFEIIICEGDFRNASILVTNEMLGQWLITKGELYAKAKENSYKKFKPELTPIIQLIRDVGYDGPFPDGVDNIPMYVLSNKNRIHGASIIALKLEMQKIAKKLGCSYYILPSSIHELIILPYDQTLDVNWLKSMVRSVNQSDVSEEDILSDSVYYFDISEGIVTLA